MNDVNLCKSCMASGMALALQFSCFPGPSAKLPSLCRLDLEAGTFLTPLEMQKLTEINEVVTILSFQTFQQSNASQKFAFRFLSWEWRPAFVCSKHFLALRNPRLPILTCCGDGGIVESYDLRDPSPLQLLKALSFLSQGFVWMAMDGWCRFIMLGSLRRFMVFESMNSTEWSEWPISQVHDGGIGETAEACSVDLTFF